MHPLYSEFVSYLDAEDREKCVQMILARLERQALDIVTLYNELLTPAMRADFCTEADHDACIWKEHVRTSIVRTVIECSYPYLLRERSRRASVVQANVLVVCPPGELHELGARMVADFFTLCGFRVTFSGANTPQDEIVAAIRHTRPSYIALSVTNYYNLVATRKLITRIRELEGTHSFRLILGGQSCAADPDTCRSMGADMVIHTFSEIEALAKGVK